jgi:hypothetical protein
MVSGIKPEEDLVKIYNELKINRTLKCIILTINKDNNGLEVAFTGDNTFSYKDLFEHLPDNDAR